MPFLTTARMTSFNPGQSPPPVNIPMRIDSPFFTTGKMISQLTPPLCSQLFQLYHLGRQSWLREPQWYSLHFGELQHLFNRLPPSMKSKIEQSPMNRHQ